MINITMKEILTKGFYILFSIFVLLSTRIELIDVTLGSKVDVYFVAFCVLSITFMTFHYTRISKKRLSQMVIVTFVAISYAIVIKTMYYPLSVGDVITGTVFLAFTWYLIVNSKMDIRQSLLIVLLQMSLTLISPKDVDFKSYYVIMLIITLFVGLKTMDTNFKLSKSLTNHERLHNILFNNSNEAFAIHEMVYENDRAIDYKFISINEAFTTLTGLTEEQVINKTILQVLPELDPFWITTYAEVLKEQKSKVFTAYDSSMRKHFNVVAVPATEKQFATLFLDVSAQVRSEQLLKETHDSLQVVSNLKTQFLKDINHRVRTPLNGLYGMLQLIKEDVKEEQQELIDCALTETEHIRNITNQVSKYVDLQSLEYHLSIHNLHESITEVTDDFSDFSEYISVVFSKNLDKSHRFDKSVFKSVLRELLCNAIRYAPQKNISVTCAFVESEDSQKMQVIVEDDGKGLNEEQIKYIFNEFYHHNSMEIYKEDNQLSLAMCKQLMMNCGGDLYFEDVKDSGARFIIVLPNK